MDRGPDSRSGGTRRECIVDTARSLGGLSKRGETLVERAERAKHERERNSCLGSSFGSVSNPRTMTERIDVTSLLAESRWLASLARRLVADGAQADDLAQETLASALQRPPAADRPLRGWLATALRSRWRDESRAQRARLAREQSHSRREALPSTLDVVAKAELQRELVQALLSLDEPYRTTVLLRFFEGLAPREIARRMRAPVATVHSRLQRGLAQLRERLDRDRPRTQWLAAFAPLARDPSGLAPWTVGVSIVNAAIKVAVPAVVVLACVWWWTSRPKSAVDVPQGVVTAPLQRDDVSHEPGERSGELARSDEGAVSRAAQAPAVSPAVPAQAVIPRTRLVHGRVFDEQGIGLAGVRLGYESSARDESSEHHEPPTKELQTSGTGGRFEFELPPEANEIVSIDPRWSTVLAGSARIQPANEAGVLVAPRIDLAGRVVDENGAPLAEVELTVHVPQHLGADLGILLDYSVARAWRTHSDARGEFRLANVPGVARAAFHARLAGYAAHVESLPEASNDALVVTLERPHSTESLVRGVVLDPSGAFFEGARVSAGAEVCVSDAHGAFALDVSGSSLARVVAVARGFQPAVFEPEHDDAASMPVNERALRVRWPSRVVLQLGGAALSIVGRVLDAQREPLAGARVWIVDPTCLGQSRGDVVLAESYAAGAEGAFWSFARTDADGRFTLEGLAQRDYSVAALDPRTLLRVDREHVRAGERDVDLVLPGELRPRLRGRVVARDGTPLAGVSVKFQRPALEVAVPGGTRDEWVDSSAVTTAADGSYELANLPREGVEIFAWGDAILFAGRELERDADVEHFDIAVDRRVHLQVELDLPLDRADELRVLDAQDQPMILRIMRGESAFTSRKSSIEDGRSQVLSLGEGARSLVLFKSGVEIGRLPLRLDPSRPNVVRY